MEINSWEWGHFRAEKEEEWQVQGHQQRGAAAVVDISLLLTEAVRHPPLPAGGRSRPGLCQALALTARLQLPWLLPASPLTPPHTHLIPLGPRPPAVDFGISSS